MASKEDLQKAFGEVKVEIAELQGNMDTWFAEAKADMAGQVQTLYRASSFQNEPHQERRKDHLRRFTLNGLSDARSSACSMTCFRQSDSFRK